MKSKTRKIQEKKPVKRELPILINRCMHEILAAQEQFLLNPEKPSTTHQFRITLRQLRSLISFFKPLYAPAAYLAYQEKLRDMTSRFAGVRELDVIGASWLKIKKNHQEQLAENSELDVVLTKERAELIQNLYPFIASGDAMLILVDVWAWLLQGFDKEDAQAAGTLDVYICRHLKLWLKQADDRMPRGNISESSGVHPLRIRYKKLRYMLNLLSPLLSKKHRASFVQVKAMQVFLGTICDTRRNVVVLKALSEKHPDKDLAFETGILMGYQMCGLDNMLKIGKQDT